MGGSSGRPLIVVNPRSASGRTGRTFAAMLPAIERMLGAVDVVKTERPAHAIELAHAGAREERRLVVGVGGDGTFNEIVNGVLGARPAGEGPTQVGFIAQGTGGDFRKTLGLEHRLEAYLDALGSGRERRVDVGRMRYKDARGAEAVRYFVNILSVGMGGLVDRYVAESSGMWGGKAAYFAASARALAACKRGRVICRVRAEGRDEQRVVSSYMIAVCNGRYFGGGMHVAPMAAVDDGRFEVVSLDAPSKLAFTSLSRKIYTGEHLKAPGTSHFACERIELDLENEDARDVFLIDCDGEPLGGLPITIDVVPGALALRA